MILFGFVGFFLTPIVYLILLGTMSFYRKKRPLPESEPIDDLIRDLFYACILSPVLLIFVCSLLPK